MDVESWTIMNAECRRLDILEKLKELMPSNCVAGEDS